MRPYEALMAAGLRVNWGTLLIGWTGFGDFGRQVNVPDLVAFGIEKLEKATELEAPLVDELVALANNETQAPGDLLQRLAFVTGCDLALEARKWKLVAVRQLLQGLPDDPIEALQELTDFWSGFDVNEGPHIFQGVENDLSATQYYRQSTLATILARHQTWLVREEAELRTK